MHSRTVPAALLVMTLVACGQPQGPALDATVGDAMDAATVAPHAADESRVLPPFCRTPSAPDGEAVRRMGDGILPAVLPDNRALTPAGREVAVGGFPVDVRFHPSAPVVYVANTGYTDARRAVQALSRADGSLLQTTLHRDQFNGIAVAADGARLFAAGGAANVVSEFALGSDGTLTLQGSVAVDGMPSGLALAADGTRLYVGSFMGQKLTEIVLPGRTAGRTLSLPVRAYTLVSVPARNELWIAPLGGDALAVVSLATFTVAGTVPLPGNPTGLAASPDGATVYASATDADQIVAIDAATRTVRARAPVGEVTQRGADGPLPASSPTGLAFDPSRGRLYVTRAADNAIGVFDASTLAPIGAIPTGWYPTSVAVSPDGAQLAVTCGKGFGSGPLPSYQQDEEGGKERMTGTVQLVDLTTVDLSEGARRVEANLRRPAQLTPFSCDGTFPVPAVPGGPTPIEHVVLIVRENKTYDSVLGDLGDPRADADPTLAMYGEPVTPNLHALARRFANHDNFYDDSETSVQGHFWLTSCFVNDYIERTWLEDYRGRPGFGQDPVMAQGTPDFGTFFSHMIRYNVPFVNFGEVVGLTSSWNGRQAFAYVDRNFPGVFFNTGIKDEVKARYVNDRLVNQGVFPRFVYLLLPNDHTNGLGAGALTPASMIADNDYATGLVVEAISKSRFWPSTAVFILQDDTQIGADHVDYHRSVLVIASPWARAGHVSHVHASYPAVFRTIEHILGLPPMNRNDANASPLWDSFTSTPDLRPFDAVPRRTPDAMNPSRAFPGAPSGFTDGMDFRGPDRNPELGALLWHAARGSAPPPQAHAQWSYGTVRSALRTGRWPRTTRSGDPDDAVEARYEREGLRAYARWLRAHPDAASP